MNFRNHVYILISVAIFLMLPFLASAEVIFQDDYDNPGDLGWICNDGLRTGYTTQSSCASSTYDLITHWCGDITANGRGGNALTMWRRNGIWANNSELNDYCGYLGKYFTEDEFDNHYKELFIRWYVKIPPQWDAYNPMGIKFNRAHHGTSAGSAAEEWYLNMSSVDNDDLPASRLSLYITTQAPLYSQQSVGELGLNNGNWHSIEVRMKIGATDGGGQIFVDGTALDLCAGGPGYWENCGTNHTNLNTGGANDYFTKLIDPGLGNITEGQWNFPTAGWYSMYFDDYVVSTTYIGPVSGDTTPPSSPSEFAVL